MGCNCGKPKCKGQCGCKSPAVLQINNPSNYITFHKVNVPAAMGDSKTNPPAVGKYKNVLLYYEADQTSWLYSSDGIPVKLTNGITNYEDAINLPQINGNTLIGDKSSSDLGLQSELHVVENTGLKLENGGTLSGVSATENTIGMVKPGDGLSVQTDGTLDVDNPAPDGFFDGDATEENCGSSAAIENVLGGKPENLKIYGATEQQTYAGKNLLNTYQWTGRTNIGISGSINVTGTINISGVASANGNAAIINLFNQNIPAGTYVLSIDRALPRGIYVHLTLSDSTFKNIIIPAGSTSSPAETLSTNAVAYDIRYGSLVEDESVGIYDLKMQLESGSTPSAYEPFVGNAASPNPLFAQAIRSVSGKNILTMSNGSDTKTYEINLGKNIFNKNKYDKIEAYVNGSGVITSGGGITTVYLKCKPNTTYTVQKTNQGTNPRFCVFDTEAAPEVGDSIIHSVGTRTGADTATAYTITTSAKANYLCVFLRVSASSLSESEIVSTLQIEEGGSASTYSEYFNPIELRSLSNRSDYIYKRDGRWFIHQEIDHAIVDSLNDGDSHAIDTASTNTTRVLINKCLSGQGIYTPSEVRGAAKCNRFINGSVWSADTVGFFIDTNAGLTKNGLCFRGLKTEIGTTEEDVEAWLNANPLDIYYVLATPVEKQIIEPSVVAQLDAVSLYAGENSASISGVYVNGEICISGHSDNWNGVTAILEDALAKNRRRFFHFTPESSFDDIKTAFASEDSKVIEFEPGVYKMSSRIFLGSNTIINLNGATLSRGNTSNMIFGYPLDTTATGYNGVHNVIFNNGTLDLSMALMHNTNFEFNNVTFGPNITTHAIQIAASKDISFNGCVFKGRTIDGSVTTSQQEILQLERATRPGQPWLIDAGSSSYDNVGVENITVEGCTFESGDGINYGMYTAIGHHSGGSGQYNAKNVVIKNNTFGTTIYSPLTPAGWDGYEISGNTFTYTGATDMIIIRHRWSNRNGVIRNNIFNGGWIALGSGNVELCTNLLVDGNDFTMTSASNNSHAMDIVGWNGLKITNNIFRSSAGYYLNAYTGNSIVPTNVIIENNTFNVGYSNTTTAITYFSTGTNVSVTNNTVYLKSHSQYFVSLGENYGDSLIYSNNTLISPDAEVRSVYAAATLYPSPESIYDTDLVLYSGVNSYTELTNVTPNYKFASFNTVTLIVHKSGDAAIKMTYSVDPWTVNKRLSDARNFYIALPDTDGTMMLGHFVLNADGTFSYSSSTNNLSLRSIHGMNTLKYRGK